MGKLNKIALSFILLVLLAGIVISARYSLSDIAWRQAQAEIDIWTDTNTVTSLSNWDSTYELLQKAIHLRPDGADAYSSLGYLYEWRGFSIEGKTPSRIERSESRSNAIQAYRTAVGLRPSWPIEWSRLARLKSLAGQWDAEFEQALLTAIALGQNEPRVQEEVTAIATSLTWIHIKNNPSLREPVISIVAQGLMSNERLNRRLKLLRGEQSLLNIVCPELDLDSITSAVQRFCKNNTR